MNLQGENGSTLCGECWNDFVIPYSAIRVNGGIEKKGFYQR